MLNIPFYKNTKDDTRCLPACWRMVLKYYLPNKNYPYHILDPLIGHKPKQWTWQSQGLLYLANLGFEVVNIENLDYKKFVRQGKKYLAQIWSKEVFEVQEKYSDLDNEQIQARKLIKNPLIKLINKKISISDIERYFYDGFLVMISINPYVLERKKGYASHLVLITAIEDNNITFHDPGLPPIKNRKVGRKTFIKAMSKPWKEDNNLIAVKWKEI
ncbi:MAG: hypothetical protein WDZ85_02125 [Candidatus Paceibacterota bacterium]